MKSSIEGEIQALHRLSTPIGLASVLNLRFLSFEAICFAGHARVTFARTHHLGVSGDTDGP